MGTAGHSKGTMERSKDNSGDRREKEKETRSCQPQESDEVPSEEFWDDFFSEENFRGKTLGEFLDDATPSPATMKGRLAFFDVPHRELFYKEEDLRHFRKDGTFIGIDNDDDIDDDSDNDNDIDNGIDTDAGECGRGDDCERRNQHPQAEAAAAASPRAAAAADRDPSRSESGPGRPGAQEDGRPSPPPGSTSTSTRTSSGGHARVRQVAPDDPMDLDDELPQAPRDIPGSEQPAGLDGLGLDLGAAAFAAASAEYGRSSSSSSSAGLLSGSLPSQGGGGGGGGGGGETTARTTDRSSEGSGKSSGVRSKASTAAVSSSSSSSSSRGRGVSGDGGFGKVAAGKNGSKGGERQGAVLSSLEGKTSMQQQQQQQEQGGKRRAGSGSGSAAVGATGRGKAPASKRKKGGGGVLAPTSSSLGKAIATAAAITDLDINSAGDPMQKKLLQFRQQKATVNTNTSTTAKGTKAAVQTTVAAPSTGGRGRSSTSRGRAGVASALSTAAAAAVSRTGPAGAASAASRGVGGVSGGSSTRSGGVFRIGVSSAEAKRGASSNAPTSTVAAAAAASAAAGVKGAPVPSKNGPGIGSRTVSKPVTTVKRSVGGNAAAAAGRGKGRTSREKPGGVKRKAPVLLSGMSGNVTDRKRRPGPRKAKATSKTAQDKDDSAALSFNDDLKAKLAEHNRGLMKGRCTYEPSKGRVKDWKKWERQSGKKYSSLNPDEKTEANREILAMLAAEKEA